MVFFCRGLAGTQQEQVQIWPSEQRVLRVLSLLVLYHWQVSLVPLTCKVSPALLVPAVNDVTKTAASEKIITNKTKLLVQLQGGPTWPVQPCQFGLYVTFHGMQQSRMARRNFRIGMFGGTIIIPLICWRMSGWVFCDQSLQI